MNNLVAFTASYQHHLLKGDACAGNPSAAGVLCIHGGGTSDRSRYTTMRSSLQERGFGSVAFDCVGHGETGGLPAQSSLISRTHQAAAVLQARDMKGPLTVVGASMGAYAAIDLARTRRVDSLVLIVPAVYAPDAYRVPFGPEFSSIIRQHRSWADTDAWKMMEGFEGSLLVIAAEFDAVIPSEIPQRMIGSALAARWKKLHVVKGVGHGLLSSLLDGRPATDVIVEDVVTCIESGRRVGE
jgi:pimeloyl-ACP methyl ester carboxylesterase